MKKLIPLLLLLVSMPSLAQRQFDIEVIIFKRAVNPEKVNESWPNDIAQIDFKRSGAMSDANYRGSKGVKMLPYSAYELTGEVEKLKKHAGYSVLFHKAWRQGDQSKAYAPTFHIRAGKDYSSTFNVDGTEKGNDDNHSSPVDGVTEVAIDKPLYELDGKLQVYVQHYLYAETQLDLKAPSSKEVVITAPTQNTDPLAASGTLDSDAVAVDTNAISGSTTEQNGANADDANVIAGHLQDVAVQTEVQTFLKDYRLDQKRRMRSNETHYLDHPLLGMIIQVRRVAN
ncbi:peptidoglycan binding protein CsiV [Vibrio methylphosphonaticus]|uniref:peptidoglycan binding protein CsiV n=1 Tax=Vibrio methylphosphonaticus TaxID=2946866 RepID=UPI002029EA30|nr:peptidoglycan binding protein CsiV [Vibrio methylphosphonaticus]MCL9774665.1 peptidoglycan binding protein CsiV [Vibrio methylphosphonaticus]